MNEKHPIDDFFKRGLEDHKTRPSGAAWEKVNAEISGIEGSRRGGFKLVMRAAVISLFIGLSTFFYFQKNEALHHVEPIENKKSDVTATEEKERGAGKTSVPAEKNPEKKTPAKKENKEVPIMKSSTQKMIIVSEEIAETPRIEVPDGLIAIKEPVDEELAAAESNMDALGPPVIKIRLKLKSPEEQQKMYTEYGSEKSDKSFKEKLYAYASDQFDNLKRGRRPELPKVEGKPRLEINLDKFFNN